MLEEGDGLEQTVLLLGYLQLAHRSHDHFDEALRNHSIRSTPSETNSIFINISMRMRLLGVHLLQLVWVIRNIGGIAERNALFMIAHPVAVIGIGNPAECHEVLLEQGRLKNYLIGLRTNRT